MRIYDMQGGPLSYREEGDIHGATPEWFMSRDWKLGITIVAITLGLKQPSLVAIVRTILCSASPPLPICYYSDDSSPNLGTHCAVVYCARASRLEYLKRVSGVRLSLLSFFRLAHPSTPATITSTIITTIIITAAAAAGTMDL